ncbi:uncharacterized protein DNG_04394 [Cephalotrichum gorgonifer]|uniref:NB-ARC domain-containing protein n=1 Tax=Cephalotrichum gorgonifer TaxID=2041049 RepID=A0AAE8MVZ7_9PEZI|nr:uncharacterized protein DNG_04394 [Cephalotrichum gorgonifer]
MTIPKNIPARVIESDRLGLKVLYEPQNADDIDVDIVAVHGLGADADWTWTHKVKSPGTQGSSKTSTPGSAPVNWLSDLNMLPDATPSARIMSFSYDSIWYGDVPVNQELSNVANTLLHRLLEEREFPSFGPRNLFKPDGAEGRRTVTVQALGGMGKTQLAVAYAKRHRDAYSAVFWLNARDEMTLKEGYLRLAKQILRQHPSVDYITDAVNSIKITKHDENVEAVKKWLDQRKNSQWLVIYDNYDNPALDGNPNDQPDEQTGVDLNTDDDDIVRASQPYDIRPFLPTIHHGSILITTRSPKVEMGTRMLLGRMSVLKDSLQILANASGRPGLNKDTGAIKLAKALGGLPLALSTAGAYLNGVSISFAQYLALYQGSWLKHSSNAAELLRLWAYFDNQDLWFGLLRAGYETGPDWFQDLTHNILQFHEAIRVLCQYGLAGPNKASDKNEMELQGYSMHACVHMWAVHVLNEKQDADMARLAIQCVAAMQSDYSELKGRLVRHADRCLAMEKMNKVSTVEEGDEWVLHNLGDLYTEDSQFENAEAMYMRALSGREKLRGPEDHLTLKTATNLGILYEYHFDCYLANPLFSRVLQSKKKALGSKHPSTLAIVRHLGIAHEELGNHQKAEHMYIRALKGYKKVLSPLARPTLDIMVTLGDFYNMLGQSQKCEARYMEALDGYEKSLGPGDIATLQTAYKLGILYRDLERFEEATVKLRQARQGYISTLSPNGMSTIEPAEEVEELEQLALTYRDNGRIEAATIMYWTLAKGYEKVLGPTHMATIDACNSIGILLTAQGRFDSAEKVSLWVLQRYERDLGPDHIKTLETVNNLASSIRSNAGLATPRPCMSER